jgi:hypothetical protein
MNLNDHTLSRVLSGDTMARRQFIAQFSAMVNYCARDVSTAGTPWTFADVRQELWLSIFSNNCELLRKCTNPSALPGFLKVSLSHKARDIGRQIARERARKQHAPTTSLHGAEQTLTENHLRHVPCVSAPESRIRELRQAVISSEISNLQPSSAGLLKALLFDRRPTADVMAEFRLPNTNALYKKKHYALKRLSITARRAASESATWRDRQAKIEMESVYLEEKNRFFANGYVDCTTL